MPMIGAFSNAVHPWSGRKRLSHLSLEYFFQEFLFRNQVKIGFTSVDLVNGAYPELANSESSSFDLEYMHRRSLWLGLKMVFFTAFKENVNQNAY